MGITNEAALQNETPDRDLTIPDIIRLTGISRDKAYGCVFHGEYRIGKQRRVRKEIFMLRRSCGQDICK